MATNEIKPFGASGTTGAIGAGADALTPAAYDADPQRLTGHQAGIARRELENTALRQTSHVAAGVAQFIANRYAPGVVDDGDLDKIEDGLTAAIAEMIPDEVPQATTTIQGKAELATNTECVTGTDTQRIVTPAGLAAALAALGSNVETLIVLPGAMVPSDTDGASNTTLVTATNGLTILVLPMPGDADSAVEFDLPMPPTWNAGTLKYKVRWIPAAGASASDDVRFTLAAVAIAVGEDTDQALGTAVAVDDQVVAAGERHETPASAELTVGGTPAAGIDVHFKLTRDHDYGASPMAEDAQVTALIIQLGKTGAESAWT